MAYTQVSTKDDLIGRIRNNFRKMAHDDGITFFVDSYGEMLGELIEGI
jgi:hypothetical protein